MASKPSAGYRSGYRSGIVQGIVLGPLRIPIFELHSDGAFAYFKPVPKVPSKVVRTKSHHFRHLMLRQRWQMQRSQSAMTAGLSWTTSRRVSFLAGAKTAFSTMWLVIGSLPKTETALMQRRLPKHLNVSLLCLHVAGNALSAKASSSGMQEYKGTWTRRLAAKSARDASIFPAGPRNCQQLRSRLSETR